jgi:tight adherence protein C
MNLFGSALVAFGLWFVIFTWVTSRNPSPLRLSAKADEEKNKSLFNETVIRAQAVLVRRLTPPSRLKRLEKVIARAGQPEGYSVEKMILLKVAGATAGGFGGVVYFAQRPGLIGAFVLIIGVVGGFVVPEMLVSSRADARRDEVRQSLPDAIDQLAVTVRAGLSVDGALVRVSTTLRGPLSEELTRVVQDIQLGMARTDALKSMADRMDIAELNYFVRALVQADSLGIPVAETLTSQAEEMRMKRRQRAEEQAMKLPVKILAPMVVCILPSLLIIVMGPAVIQLMRNL